MTEGLALAELRQQAVRDELQRLLESPAFRGSKRCRDFLQFIVDKTVSGPTGSLKERAIGIELFGLPPDFDTSQHTIVRVTASETRKKLAQCYNAEHGIQPAVRIDLPIGSYGADFIWFEPVPSVPVDAPTPSAAKPEVLPDQVPPAASPQPLVRDDHSTRRRWLLLAGGGGVGFVGLAGIYAWTRKGRSTPNDNRKSIAPPVSGSAPASALNASIPIRIRSGIATPYTDRNGQTWGADRYFTGGNTINRAAERVFRSLDPDLYRHIRTGDFRYDIPLAPGTNYDLHLHFAETGLSDFISAESSGEGQRVFRIAVNGKALLDSFDVVADAAGANVSDERVFRNVQAAADGALHLAFSPLRGTAMVSAIELIPIEPTAPRTLRLRCGWPTRWTDSTGQDWRADSYFLGGNALVRRTNPARESLSQVPDHSLYASERWGHFSYALPVSDGRYRVTLKFCEGHLGPRNTGVGGVGGRVFDVHCNGVMLLRDFDIVREAGGEGRPLDRVFPGIKPNNQGKILLTFVPNVGMACINGIEISES
jgi:hypothetical protein